ncbi:MAG: hypothetical protein Q7L55_11520 [Actinomycetota bacterium]|nr:hypothetical protein [Actinomycetota bacterium]
MSTQWLHVSVEPGPVLVQFQGEVYAGQLVSWREDRDQNTWKGLVQFSRGGRKVELWFPQGQIRTVNVHDASVEDEQWSADAVDRMLASIEEAGQDPESA